MKKIFIKQIVIGLLAIATAFSASAAGKFKMTEMPNNRLYIEYSAFDILYNCDKRGYDMFVYNTVKDTGSLDRYEKFSKEKRIPEKCSQTSTWPYKRGKNEAPTYDRGHGVHQNIFDHNKKILIESNFMTNIVPQESTQNRKGLWRHLEKVTECFRDENDLYVIGGVIWGNDTSNDYFMKSHGVPTPDYLYKIIVFNHKYVYSWIMPNTDEAKFENADKYLVTPNEIQKKVNYHIPIPTELKDVKEKTTPRIPKGCSLK